MDVLFDNLTKVEIEDTCEYYEIEIPGLGLRFKDEVKKAIRRICENPNAWTVEKDSLRRYLLHKFPYKIIYSIETEYIYIIALKPGHKQL